MNPVREYGIFRERTMKMTDAFNKEVKVGDKVVYIKKVAGYGSKVLLAKGTVKEIKGRIMKVTGHNYGVMSQSVMKLEV